MKLRSLDLRNFKVHRRKLNLVISISTKVGFFGIMRAKSACKVNQIRTKYIELIINLNEFKIIFALILLYLGPCRTIQNTSKCTDGSCTTTATDEMTCSSGVTINTSSTNNNTNGKKKSRYICTNIWHCIGPNNIGMYILVSRQICVKTFNRIYSFWFQWSNKRLGPLYYYYVSLSFFSYRVSSRTKYLIKKQHIPANH